MGDLRVNNTGAWTEIFDCRVNDAGTWRQLHQIWVNDSGTWRLVMTYSALIGVANLGGGTYGYDFSLAGTISFNSILSGGATYAIEIASTSTSRDFSLSIVGASAPTPSSWTGVYVERTDGSIGFFLFSAATYTPSGSVGIFQWGTGTFPVWDNFAVGSPKIIHIY